jgi:hypothetical protein
VKVSLGRAVSSLVTYTKSYSQVAQACVCLYAEYLPHKPLNELLTAEESIPTVDVPSHFVSLAGNDADWLALVEANNQPASEQARVSLMLQEAAILSTTPQSESTQAGESRRPTTGDAWEALVRAVDPDYHVLNCAAIVNGKLSEAPQHAFVINNDVQALVMYHNSAKQVRAGIMCAKHDALQPLAR